LIDSTTAGKRGVYRNGDLLRPGIPIKVDGNR
jgi:hypothetical protein